MCEWNFLKSKYYFPVEIMIYLVIGIYKISKITPAVKGVG